MVRWLVLLSVVALLLAGCVCIHSEKSMTTGCTVSCEQPPSLASQAK